MGLGTQAWRRGSRATRKIKLNVSGSAVKPPRAHLVFANTRRNLRTCIDRANAKFFTFNYASATSDRAAYFYPGGKGNLVEGKWHSARSRETGVRGASEIHKPGSAIFGARKIYYRYGGNYVQCTVPTATTTTKLALRMCTVRKLAKITFEIIYNGSYPLARFVFCVIRRLERYPGCGDWLEHLELKVYHKVLISFVSEDVDDSRARDIVS
ncbi:hypothetical protein U1Q18_046057 [Sarracenia purpurea var. burkii]